MQKNIKKRIIVAYGTRPELIKLVSVIYVLKKTKDIDLLILNTGQHKEMLKELEIFFKIKPDICFNVMKHDQTLNYILATIVNKFNTLIDSFSPNLVVVQGDTTTVLSIGIASFYRQVPVAHIEAGLRSDDIYNPYPEEFNRRVVSLFANYNFAPTKASANNLAKEKISRDKIYITGNTVVDALNYVLVKKKLKNKVSVNSTKKILITAHRRENHGEGIENVCKAVQKILSMRNDIEFVWPVHPNPNVLNTVKKMLGNNKRVKLTTPLSYLELVSEMHQSYLIWTDSGGIQEEAPSLKKPVLILRSTTERPEVISSGFGKIVGVNIGKIVASTLELIDNANLYKKRTSGKNPFGNGNAASKIVNIIINDWRKLHGNK